MRYSLGFKEAQVKKVLPPNNKTVASVAREAGISDQTLRNWLAQAKDGTLKKHDNVGGSGRSAREKFNLVIESKSVSKNDHGKWLREKGLHSEHITLYEQELRDMVEDKGKSEKDENKRLKRETKRLQKELDKKEKALAEMAALYTLKKKAEELWGEEEAD